MFALDHIRFDPRRLQLPRKEDQGNSQSLNTASIPDRGKRRMGKSGERERERAKPKYPVYISTQKAWRIIHPTGCIPT